MGVGFRGLGFGGVVMLWSLGVGGVFEFSAFRELLVLVGAFFWWGSGSPELLAFLLKGGRVPSPS